MNRLSIFTIFTLAVLLPLSTQAQVTVLLSETTDAFPTNPNADLGLAAEIERLTTRPDISTNGRFIGIEVELLADNSMDDTAVLIDLQTGTQTVLAQQGTTLLAGELVGGIADIVAVNNSGQAAFHAGDSVAAFWNGTSLTRLFGEGDPAPSGAPRSNYGNDFGRTQLTNAGIVGGQYDSEGQGTAPDRRDDFLSLGSTILVAGNTSLPGYEAQAGGTGLTESFWDFDLSPDGSNWIAEIRFDDSSNFDTTLTINGTVVAQEALTPHTTPGGTELLYDSTEDAAITDGGDWIVQARSTLAIDYTLVNGVVVFAEGESGPDGITISSIGGITINNATGDYVSLLNTSDANSVLVLNEDTIILTEGDTLNLDYNGDGISEELVIDNFPSRVFNLADDGTFTVIVTFNDLDDNLVGNALLTFDVNNPPSNGGLLGDVNLDTVVDFLDISPFILRLSTNEFQFEADIDGSGSVDFLDISPFIILLSGT